LTILHQWLAYLDEQVGFGVYVWGAQGQRAAGINDPEGWIRNRSTSTTTAKKAVDFYRRMAAEVSAEKIRFFDCSGLAMYFFQNLHGIADDDTTAHGLWRGCVEVKMDALKSGDFVFRETDGRMSHIGYVAADGMIIEARASGYGVEKRALSAGGWTHGGRHKWLKKDIEAQDDVQSEPEGGRGEDTQSAAPNHHPSSAQDDAQITRWQNLLLTHDPDCLPKYGADGKYGRETDAAVTKLIDALRALRRERGYA